MLDLLDIKMALLYRTVCIIILCTRLVSLHRICLIAEPLDTYMVHLRMGTGFSESRPKKRLGRYAILSSCKILVGLETDFISYLLGGRGNARLVSGCFRVETEGN